MSLPAFHHADEVTCIPACTVIRYLDSILLGDRVDCLIRTSARVYRKSNTDRLSSETPEHVPDSRLDLPDRILFQQLLGSVER